MHMSAYILHLRKIRFWSAIVIFDRNIAATPTFFVSIISLVLFIAFNDSADIIVIKNNGARYEHLSYRTCIAYQ